MHMRLVVAAACVLGACAFEGTCFVAPNAALGVPLRSMRPRVAGAGGRGVGGLGSRFGGGLALCMQEAGGDGDGDRLDTLIKRREEVLEEKAALLKKRKKELVLDISKLERKQKDKASERRAAKAEEGEESLGGMNLFDMAGGSGEGGGGGTRRQLLSRILTGITLSLAGLGLLLVLFAPGLERLAYLSFASLFEEGVIYLTNQVAKTIDEEDYDKLADISQANGRLADKLLQPMVFWSEGNSGDPDQQWAQSLLALTERADKGVLALQEAAVEEDADKAVMAYGAIKEAVQEYVRQVNTHVKNDLPPLSEVK